jgi:hypothetical protein
MKNLSFLLLILLSDFCFANDWLNINEMPESDWDTITWKDDNHQCEIVASKIGWANHYLEIEPFIQLSSVQVNDYAGANCILPKDMIYVLVRGVYFGGNGSFGIGEANNNLVVVYSGLGKQPVFEHSALVVAVKKLPTKIYVGTHVVN